MQVSPGHHEYAEPFACEGRLSDVDLAEFLSLSVDAISSEQVLRQDHFAFERSWEGDISDAVSMHDTTHCSLYSDGYFVELITNLESNREESVNGINHSNILSRTGLFRVREAGPDHKQNQYFI